MNHRSISRLFAFLLVASLGLCLLTTPVLFADDFLSPPQPVQVEAQIAPIRLRINAGDIDGQRALYPLLLHKDITYIPLTFNLCQALGLESSWERAYGLRVLPDPYIPFNQLRQDLLPDSEPDQIPGQPVTAVTATTAVYLASKAIDNSKQEWPLLVYQDITYLPLTWNFIHDMLHISYEFVGGADATLSLQRSFPNVKIDAERMNQIVTTATADLTSEPLISTTTVTQNGYAISTSVARFDPKAKVVWHSVYADTIGTGVHLLSITTMSRANSTASTYAPVTTAPNAATGATYTPGSSSTSSTYAPATTAPNAATDATYAPSIPSTSVNMIYRSNDGKTWQSVDSAVYAVYLPTQPKLPAFDLVAPVEGWQIQNEDGEWFMELEDMTLIQEKDGTGIVALYTYRFDIGTWRLTRITVSALPLLDGMPQSTPDTKKTITKIEYGALQGVPRP